MLNLLVVCVTRGGVTMCKISPHVRNGHMVRGHFRQYGLHRVWISDYYRDKSYVNYHCIVV